MCGPNHWAPIAGTHHEIKDASSPQTAGAEERSEPLKCLGGFVHGHLTGMESQTDLLELPIRICATSSERAIRSCLSKSIDTEPTAYLTSEPAVTRRGVPSIPWWGRPWRGASTNHEQAGSDSQNQPNETNNAIGRINPSGNDIAWLRRGASSPPQADPLTLEVSLTWFCPVAGKWGSVEGRMVKRAVGSRPLAGERDCLLSIAKKGTFTRHSVCHKSILSICSLCCPRVFKNPTPTAALSPISIIHFTAQTTQTASSNPPTHQPTNTTNTTNTTHIPTTHHAPLALQLPRPRRPRRPQSPRAPRRLRPRRRRVGSPLHDGRHRRPRHRALRWRHEPPASRSPAC